MLGKQGAGKGTQCIRLSRHYVVPHISTGDMFRGAVRSRSEAGLQAKRYMDAGDLVPDSVVIGLVAERLAHTDTSNRGFILDGFPRTVAQAEALAELLAPRELDVVVDLQVETEVVLKRLASRRVCTDCGANYSSKQPPKVDGVCDVCGGEVVQREDDTEAAIRRRLELYERETAPLIAWYAAQGILTAIDGLGPPDEVAARLVRVVEQSRQRSLIDAARRPSAPLSPSPSPSVVAMAAGAPGPGASAAAASDGSRAAGAAASDGSRAAGAAASDGSRAAGAAAAAASDGSRAAGASAASGAAASDGSRAAAASGVSAVGRSGHFESLAQPGLSDSNGDPVAGSEPGPGPGPGSKASLGSGSVARDG
jgi:adenylate kinase